MSSVNSEASLPNSQSNPPPHRPKVSKMLSVQVHFLDDSVMVFHVQQKAFGRVLFEQVCKTLSLLEVDYFGLEYTDSGGSKYWLDYEKPLCRQMGLSMVTPTMYFCVKFYTPDPAQLEEEYTRYIYSLQIKRDLAQGVLQCNDNTAALMASYIVQAECGDYEADDYPDHTYLSSFKFVPHQDAEFERKIMENHKKHVGQSPAEADLNLLETARRCELYGIRMTPAKDHEGVPLNLATAHMGVLVFQNYTKINTFSWAKIRKLSFKRKKFLIKLHPEGYGYYQDTVEFFFEGRNECKNFWKKCIEHHGFFRCAEVRPLPRQKARIFSRGSSFRYSGRTQKQIVEYVRENYIKRQPFQRSTSLRVSSTARNSLGKVGTSISAQPLLPVCDTQSSTSVTPNVEAAGASSHPPCEETREQRPASVSPAHEERPAIANGTICTNGRRTPQDSLDHLPGLETPDLGQDSEGLRSPDFLGNDTDDNISHDSYHLDEREEPVDQRCDLQGSSDALDNIKCKSPDRVSEPKAPQVDVAYEIADAVCENDDAVFSEALEDPKFPPEQTAKPVKKVVESEDAKETNNGEIPYVLHRRHLPPHSDADNEQNPRTVLSLSPKDTVSHRAKVRVELDRTPLAHSSPLLYARANRLSASSSSGREILPKSPRTSRTVDVVSFRQLPSTGSFSSQDDSLDDGSLERSIFEHLRKRQFEKSDAETNFEASLPPPPEWLEAASDEENVNVPRHEISLEESKQLNYPLQKGEKELNSDTVLNTNFRNASKKEAPAKSCILTMHSRHVGDLNSNVCDKYVNEPAFNLKPSLVARKDVSELSVCSPKGTSSAGTASSPPFVSRRSSTHRVSFSSVEDCKDPPKSPYALHNDPSLVSVTKDEHKKSNLEAHKENLEQAAESDMLDQELGEAICDSSDEEDVAISVSSSSSREMHRLSEAHMHEAHFVLSEDDLTLDEEDTLEESHVESVYLEIAPQEEETIHPHSHYSYGSYRFSHASSLDEGSSAEGDCEAEENSMQEGMEMLEDISEHMEGFSDEETAPITDVSPSKGISEPNKEESVYCSFIELEVSGGHVVGATSSSPNNRFS